MAVNLSATPMAHPAEFDSDIKKKKAGEKKQRRISKADLFSFCSWQRFT